MRPKKLELITCPKCGCEYFPAEIFIPQSIIGTVKNIKRDQNNKIISYEGVPFDNIETFECNVCNCTFKAIARMSYTSEYRDELSFNEDYVTPIVKRKVFMKED